MPPPHLEGKYHPPLPRRTSASFSSANSFHTAVSAGPPSPSSIRLPPTPSLNLPRVHRLPPSHDMPSSPRSALPLISAPLHSPQPSPSSALPPLPTSPRHTGRSRWFFSSKATTPPPTPTSRSTAAAAAASIAPVSSASPAGIASGGGGDSGMSTGRRRSRAKHERKIQRRVSSNHDGAVSGAGSGSLPVGGSGGGGRRSGQHSWSERSSRSSVDDVGVGAGAGRRTPRFASDVIESPPAVRHTAPPPTSPNLSVGGGGASANASLPSPAVEGRPSSSGGGTVDDWGLDELSDDEPQPVGKPVRTHSAHRHSGHQSDVVPPSIRSDDSPTLIRHAAASIESPRVTVRDTLTLRAFDDTPQRHSSVPPELSGVGNVIGVYADPAAETDDWGDDFVLENASVEHTSSASAHAGYATPQLPTWVDDSSPFHVKLSEQLRMTPPFPGLPLTAGPSIQLAVASAEVQPIADDALPIRPMAVSAFQTPKLTYSSLLMYPAVGYQASAVHPSCARVIELFSSQSAHIHKHFDALVRDSGGTIAFDENVKQAYLFSRDPDVALLAEENSDLAADALLWKFQWSSLIDDRVERARVLLSLSKLHKDSGDLQQASLIVREALLVLSDISESALSLVIAAELEYENAILHRATGALAEAGRSLMRAMTHSAAAVNCSKLEQDVSAVTQRGLWWSLRCKYLRAEIAYDLEEVDTAVQFYSEYICESVLRMIGSTAPPISNFGSLGPEFMRYCLFSPRRLVLALWTTVLCLGEMRCFSAAADLANLTTLAASAFGYEDANEAASNVRSRIKDIGVDLRQQYDEISKSVLHSDDVDTDERHVSAGPQISQMATAPFNYNVGDFGDVGDEVVEDWDAQLERELNITIQRCCDVDDGHAKGDEVSSGTSSRNGDGSNPPLDAAAGSVSEPLLAASNLSQGVERPSDSNLRRSQNHGQIRWPSGTQEGQLIEAELRQYLHRLTGSGTTLPNRLMYPKPTEPYQGQLVGPKELERFLRTFVRSKDPEWCWRTRHGLAVSPQWHPSTVCKLNFNIEPIEDIDALNFGIDILSPSLGLRLLESVWKVVRSQVNIQMKQTRVRRLILNAFSKVAASSKLIPTRDAADRLERLEMLGALLDALRLGREVITDSGKEAVWFSRACMFLGTASATVTPAAKAAVELFQAESRAHCGVNAVVPSKMVKKIARLAQERTGSDTDMFVVDGADGKETTDEWSSVPPSLRLTVVDVMHALYWRTKAGFDESSASNSMERLLHADVASSLFLVGSGISPVDGSEINLAEEIHALHIPKRRKTKSVDSDTLVDETRRVSSSELILELQSLWVSLPLSAGVVRAKISFALAHHARVTQQNYSRAERLLFDGLQSLHTVSDEQRFPSSFFSPVILVSPVSVVSSPLAGALLNGYGVLTSSHSKYRYGVAAKEADCDAVRVRNKSKRSYRAAVLDVAQLALHNNDWRRALCLLYNMRHLAHPKNGLRNEFLQLCVLMHDICRDAGCLGASVVPLRAFSALIFEERLRVLLQRYKRRLAKKKRNRIRRYLSGSPLPRLLPGSSVFSGRKNTLASFFEAPVVTAAAAIDHTIRHSASLLDAKAYASSRNNGTVCPQTDNAQGQNALHRLLSVLFPLQILMMFHRSSFSRSTKGADQGSRRSERQHRSEQQDQEGSQNESPAAAPAAVRAPQEQRESLEMAEEEQPPLVADPTPTRPELVDPDHELEQRELLRIEAEQEVAADSDRCRIELLRVDTEFARADYNAADERCRGLLGMSIPPQAKYKVLEVMALIRLKRREITSCLDYVDQMEREVYRFEGNRTPIDNGGHNDSQRMSIFRLTDYERAEETSAPLFIPQVTFLRLRALTHGGRLEEALQLADKALELCSESSFWDQGRVHYLRGKVLFEISNSSAPLFRGEAEVSAGHEDDVELTLKMTELTLVAFETSSHYFDAAGDELSAAKSDMLWARTCIDFLFRRVVLRKNSGGGVPLSQAGKLLERRIMISEVQQVVHNVLNVASNANVPMLLIDAMAALAEVKCIRGQPTSAWCSWVMEAWKLFSRLFAHTEDLSVVLSHVAPVSTLMRLRKICGRLVRLVMCNETVVSGGDMNKHLRMFEAYVRLHLSIDRKMNLASSAHRNTKDGDVDSRQESDRVDRHDSAEPVGPSRSGSRSVLRREHPRPSGTSAKAYVKVNLRKATSAIERTNGRSTKDRKSESPSDKATKARPAGAFLHMLGSEGVALGRQGITMFIHRPRKHVMSAVKDTGAVFIPTNFFANARTSPGFQSHELGKDAELIFPFKPNLGLGAMQILDNEHEPVGSGFLRRSATLTYARRHQDGTDSGSSHRFSLPKRRVISVENITETDDNGSVPMASDSGDLTKTVEPIGKNVLTFEEEFSQSTTPDGCRKSPNAQPKSYSGRSFAKSGSLHSMRRSASIRSGRKGKVEQQPKARPVRNELSALLKTISMELEHGTVEMTGNSVMFGANTAARVWAHMNRIKAETKRYMHGEINMQQLHERNYEAVLSWVQCIPLTGREWTVPESIGRRLVYILLAHGVVGYYSVERGGSIERVAFGGKQGSLCIDEGTGRDGDGEKQKGLVPTGLRPPTHAERKYLAKIVNGFLRDEVWYRKRDSEIVSGMANHVLRAPRLLLSTSSPAQKSRSRPIVLIADLSLQIVPWELFFDHVVIRSHCLLDAIRCTQDAGVQSLSGMIGNDDPAVASTRPIVKYFNFVPSRKEVAEVQRTEEARRQQLAFQGMLRLNQMNARNLISFLDLGGFSDPTAVNAVSRPTGPLSSPLTQSRNGVQLLGFRVAIASIGRRNYPHLDFVKVPGLGSASTHDLKEAAMSLNSTEAGDMMAEPRRDIGAYIPVFMFSYAELVDSSECVFGLRREVSNGILMFTPAIHMKVLARHLQDEELSVEVARASGRLQNVIFPDAVGAARVVVEHVSRFSREKRIPIVVFLGEGLMEVFPNRRSPNRAGAERKTAPAAERIKQLSGGAAASRMDFLRKGEVTC